MNKRLKTIAVDLTPVLPGSENGGAKIFVLELLRRLAKMAPQTQFILLTQSSSHQELSELDASNVHRKLIIGASDAISIRARLLNVVFRVLPHLPTRRLQRITSRLVYKIGSVMKHHRSSSLLQGINADLLFCPFTAPTYFDPRIPTVCTIYDLQYKTYPEFFTAEDVAHRDRTFSEACRKATKLASISDYSREAAIVYGKIDPSHIETIHLRMAQRALQYDETDAKVLKRFNLTPQTYLIYPANFWKHKNHEMLFAAFGMACQNGLSSDIKLVCTGSPGTRQSWLAKAAAAMGLGNRIIFPGFLPTEEFSALMANCGGVVFPSLYEGFGLPVIEAMAAGIPVACSNITSLPEVASNAAILFDPRMPAQISQAILALLSDEQLRARLVTRGLQRAAEFSDSERMAREYWKLFEHASSNTTHDDSLTGVYDDGWAGPILSLKVAPASSVQTLKIEISLPEWLPQRKIKVQITKEGTPCAAEVVVLRGSKKTCSASLELNGGIYEIRLSPTFIPALSGHGEDHRELSALLQRCSILRSNDERIELVPMKIAI